MQDRQFQGDTLVRGEQPTLTAPSPSLFWPYSFGSQVSFSFEQEPVCSAGLGAEFGTALAFLGRSSSPHPLAPGQRASQETRGFHRDVPVMEGQLPTKTACLLSLLPLEQADTVGELMGGHLQFRRVNSGAHQSW